MQLHLTLTDYSKSDVGVTETFTRIYQMTHLSNVLIVNDYQRGRHIFQLSMIADLTLTVREG